MDHITCKIQALNINFIYTITHYQMILQLVTFIYLTRTSVILQEYYVLDILFISVAYLLSEMQQNLKKI